MSRMSRIHDDYLDPDRHLWPSEHDDSFDNEPPEFERETDPYGYLTYCLGSADDFWCLDYVISKCKQFVHLHAAINSETGSFIMDGYNEVVPVNNALAEAENIVCAAIDWCGENEVEPDWKGWNTTETKFVEDLKKDLTP